MFLSNKEDENVTIANLETTVDGFENSLMERNDGGILMAEKTGPSSEELDNKVLPSNSDSIPPAESFIIPIDDPDGKLKSTNKQANSYAAKKTVAQGMMDIALITANANQLRFIVEYTSHTKTYYFNMFLITISLLLQIAIGMALIFKGRSDLRGESKFKHARRSSNFVVVGVFLVTIINVFIASFTSTSPPPVPQPPIPQPAIPPPPSVPVVPLRTNNEGLL